MSKPSLDGLLGRYEYRDGESDKFWSIEYEPMSGEYLCEWGKNGRPPQGTIRYSGAAALKKVREKIAKGYRLTGSLKPIAGVVDDVMTKIEKKRKPTENFMALFKKEIPEDKK